MMVIPASDKGILANPVVFKEFVAGLMRREFRGIYDMERGSTEVGFEHDLESMKFKISTYHVEIKRMRRAKIPGRDRMPSNNTRIYNAIWEWNCEERWDMGGIVVERIWRLRQ